jgi:hypothetical protein
MPNGKRNSRRREHEDEGSDGDIEAGVIEVLNRKSVIDEHLKKIFDNTVCSQLWMEDIVQLEMDHLETAL